MSGRKADDVIYVTRHSDFVFYMDNCTAQNKNWTIYIGMVDETVNKGGGPEEIIFCYLEKTARAWNGYDNQDFKACIDKSKVAVPMRASDFILYENMLVGALHI